MATKYWVARGGGASNDNWSPGIGVHWATTSGGAPNTTPPGFGDTAVFDASSPSPCNINNNQCQNLDASAYTGTIAGSGTLSVEGNLTLGTGNTITYSGILTFSNIGSVLANTITLAGKSLAGRVIFDDGGTGSSWTLQDDFTSLTDVNVQFLRGTFNANNKNVTIPGTQYTGSGVMVINMGTGVWTITSSGTDWSFATPTNLTVNPSTSLIKITNVTGAPTIFQGGGLTYYDIEIVDASATLGYTLVGNNTFHNFKVTGSKTVKFTAGSTTTVTTWTVTGTAGNVITLKSSADGSAWTLLKPYGSPGVLNSDYLTLQDSQATCGREPAGSTGVWFAGANSTNTSNNTGWTFGVGATFGIQVFDSLAVAESVTPFISLFGINVSDAVSVVSRLVDLIRGGTRDLQVSDSIHITDVIPEISVGFPRIKGVAIMKSKEDSYPLGGDLDDPKTTQNMISKEDKYPLGMDEY